MTPDQIAEVLRLHEMWLRGDPEGVRANLTGANLNGANLTRAYLNGAYLTQANLNGANLTRAYLNGAYLTHANLDRANLTGANLNGTVGNMREIKSAHFSRWPLVWTRSPDGVDWLQIGCKRHPLHDWASFDDDEIDEMGSRDLEWRRMYRDTVLRLVEASPATPWGKVE